MSQRREKPRPYNDMLRQKEEVLIFRIGSTSRIYPSSLLFLMQEHRQHQKAARDSRVVMYRKYRVGELPDIQIKHSELIRPFQALAQVCRSLQ